MASLWVCNGTFHFARSPPSVPSGSAGLIERGKLGILLKELKLTVIYLAHVNIHLLMSFMAQILQRCVLVQKVFFSTCFSSLTSATSSRLGNLSLPVMINDIKRRYDKLYKGHPFEDTVNQGTRKRVVTFTQGVKVVLTVLLSLRSDMPLIHTDLPVPLFKK